jgi:hypothetical protein
MRVLSLSLSITALALLTACDDAVPPPRAPVAAPLQQGPAQPGAGYPPEWQHNTALPAAAAPNAAPPAAAPANDALPRGGSVANARAVVAAMAHDFRVCYNEGLHEDATMKGSVRITAKIGPEGNVVSATPGASALGEKVVACVVARVAIARFSPPEGGGATLVVPVTFTAQ